MKRIGLFSLVLTVACAAQAAPGRDRPIRLRKETIRPAEQARTGRPAEKIARKGLALIQFQGPLQAPWRAELEEQGVELLHYVPEDAFVVRLRGTPPGRIRQLPFVSWLGKYRPHHKLHPQLEEATVSSASVALSDVSILVAAGTSDQDAARVRSLLRRGHTENTVHGTTILRGAVAAADLASLADLETVLWVEPSRRMTLYDEVSTELVSGDGGVGQTLVQSLGYDGAGVTVAVADSGLDSGEIATMHPDLAGRVTALFFYGTAGQLSSAADEHGHGTHCAGIVAGNGAGGEADENGKLYGLGVAPGANVIGQRLFDGEGGYAPAPSHETMTRDAVRAGAEIGSNSWGDDTQGAYDVSAMEFDALVRDADFLASGDQPYILEFSAGNAGPGPRTIGSPAVAKNVIATGASNSSRDDLPLEDVYTFYDTGPETMADFSSRGPCADGRIKPDIVAPGTWIASLRSVYANDAYAWWPVEGSTLYSYMGGTSQAGPHASGAAAVFVQYYRSLHGGATPSPALVKAALINSAADMDNRYDTVATPNMDEGWGRLDLVNLVASARDYTFIDQSNLLTNGAVFQTRILVGSAAEPLEITLAYTDVPGTPFAIPALVNDLDLEVIGSNGSIYRGNLLSGGESMADLAGSDTINNVETVRLAAPQPGEYLVRVRGTRVVQDARQDTPAIDQDFALVASGAFEDPGVGIVSFDRLLYTAPDRMVVALVDDDLAGQPTAAVTVRSTTEPTGEVVTVYARGTTGVFTGELATATGSVQADGLLQVRHDDLIEAVYVDVSPVTTRVFAASADLLPPVISGVDAEELYGRMYLAWDTDEPATGIAFYGTNSLALSVTSSVPVTYHEVRLNDVVPYETYQFMVVATDLAGNRSTNDHGGAFFTFSFTPPPDVLLIDAYADYVVPAPPLSGYTDALNAIGTTYDVFDARSGAEPTLAQLQGYRCVIWRMDELLSPTVTLTETIENYVHGGGSLFVASMEAVTRLGEAGLSDFASDVLQLQSYTEDQPVDTVVGAPGDPVGAGLNTTLDYTPYAELLDLLVFYGITDPSDWIAPNTNATEAVQTVGATVGVRSPRTGVDLPGKVVYLSFPLDTVPMGTGLGNNRPGLLKNILDFLAPPEGSSLLTLDREAYSVPARAVVEVEDPDRTGQGPLVVSFTSPQQTNGTSVSLQETVRKGLFRGSLSLVPAAGGVPETLAVQAGDTIRCAYPNPSSGLTNVVTASIETTPPVISGLNLDPGYLEAYVSWNTSEEADALVQYGESPNNLPINFTAYDPQFVTSRALYLTQLKADQTYYYQVVSRDRAGNVTVDDNHGQLYTFSTLEPVTLPWQDDMETNNLAWTAYAPAGYDGWSRGVPGGGVTAHSPSNCWGSNLDGGPMSENEGFLISPGIYLEGGNQATLRFRHNYDFIAKTEFDLIEIGAVEIITNAFTESVLLAQFDTDASAGWEEVEIDLTPYLGQVVNIVWHYIQLSVDAPPRLGWLVDDVSITTQTIVPSTLQVTNNLWQARYAVYGPSGFYGEGVWSENTNAAAGEYAIEYGDVNYYDTPSPQTNTLSEGGTVRFTGTYTFLDSNGNGMPDAWELEHFEVVDPLRTWSTDTDADGVSDGDEYVALTDPDSVVPDPLQLEILPEPGNAMALQWPSTEGLGYRVHARTDGSDWEPVSSWIRATDATSTLLDYLTAGETMQWYRLEVAP